jgi:hypothetical protein
VLGCALELVPWGDWGWAAVMAFAYRDPRTGESVTVEQAVRVPHADDWQPHRGSAEILCWGAAEWAVAASCLDHRDNVQEETLEANTY